MVLLALLVALNAWTMLAVLRDTLSTRGQRIAQLAFIWLLPVVGALLTLHLKRSAPEASMGCYRDAPDAGDDFAASGQAVRHIERAPD